MGSKNVKYNFENKCPLRPKPLENIPELIKARKIPKSNTKRAHYTVMMTPNSPTCLYSYLATENFVSLFVRFNNVADVSNAV